MKKSEKRLCMICEEESPELINLEVTKDNGEAIPFTINGKGYDSILVCPDCMLAVFPSNTYTPSEHTPEIDRRS